MAYWDTGELQTVAWIFGIPHPTGFPAFVIGAGLFAHLFPFGAPSWRVSFFCALLTFGSVVCAYATIVRVCADRVTAACCGCLLAFGLFFWIYGVRAEIHAMAAFCAALALYFALRGYYENDVRAFFGGALACGVGLATHPIVLFVIPSLLVLALARRNLWNIRSAAAAFALIAAPLLLYAYLPLRSHVIVARGLDPAPALGKPLGAAIWNTDNPQRLHGFLRLAGGTDFHAARSILRVADVPFYAAKAGTFAAAMYQEFSPVGSLAGVICFALLFRRRPVVACALLCAVLLPAAFALAYPPVVEIERYFFIPMIALAIAIGLGVATLATQYRNMLRIPLAIAAAALLFLNYGNAHLRSVNGAEGLIADVRARTPPDALIVADWTRGTALAYAAYVDRDFGGRRIDIAWPYQDMRYLPSWLAQRPVFYVGRPIVGPGRILLCVVSPDYPLYVMHLAPGHC